MFWKLGKDLNDRDDKVGGIIELVGMKVEVREISSFRGTPNELSPLPNGT
jgi:hypothetical protein